MGWGNREGERVQRARPAACSRAPRSHLRVRELAFYKRQVTGRDVAQSPAPIDTRSRARGKEVMEKHSRRCCHQPEDGAQCKANAQTESPYCFFHDPALDAERAEARKAGGIARTRKVTLPPDLPIKPLRTADDVAALLGETINQVRRGEIDLRVSNAIGYLSGILLSAIEKGSFEARLAALEVAVANSSRSNGVTFDEDDRFDFVEQTTVGSSFPRCSSRID